MNNNQKEYELAEKMESLRKQIETGKKDNKKIKFKTFGKRTLQILKLGTAIVFIPAITSGGCIAFGWNPYKLNSPEESTSIVSYIDSKGNKSEYETNTPYTAEHIDIITYYDTWKELDNGSYSRDIYRYKATSDSLLELVGILQTTDEISLKSVEKLISENLTKEIEIKDSLTREELEKGSYIEGVYYNKNNDKKVIVKETEEHHANSLLGFVAINILLMLIEFLVLINGTYFFENFSSAFTNNIYLIDIKTLEKRLEQVTEELQNEVVNRQKKKKLS